MSDHMLTRPKALSKAWGSRLRIKRKMAIPLMMSGINHLIGFENQVLDETTRISSPTSGSP